MKFSELLQQRKDDVVERWFEAGLAVYPDEASAAFQRQKDPFANPVGNRLRIGTREIFEALLGEMDTEVIQQQLHEIISIRAVQEFPPSRTVGFVFALKGIVRQALGETAKDPECAADLAEFDGRIDRVALIAFDIFVECRERLSELRINEVKRQVSWVVEKMNARSESDSDHSGLGVSTPENIDAQREGV